MFLLIVNEKTICAKISRVANVTVTQISWVTFASARWFCIRVPSWCPNLENLAQNVGPLSCRPSWRGGFRRTFCALQVSAKTNAPKWLARRSHPPHQLLTRRQARTSLVRIEEQPIDCSLAARNTIYHLHINGNSLNCDSMTSKRKLDEEFEKICTIGRGSYGVVYKVRRRASGDIAALKRVRLNPSVLGSEEGIPSSSLREIAALKNLNHPNILQLHDIIHTGTSLYLVFEHLDQDLKKTLYETQSGFNIKIVRSFMCQLLKAISFCHSRRILHRDIKLQNLLVNKNGIVKLADFGLARGMAMPLQVYTKDVVTLWYRAPELLLGSEIYGPAVDVWSLGGVFYEILTKKPLFPGNSEIDQLFKIFQILGTPNELQWEGISKLPYYKTSFPSWRGKDLKDVTSINLHASNLLKQMFIYDPQRRVSARDALRHPFFDELARRPTLRDIQNPTESR